VRSRHAARAEAGVVERLVRSCFGHVAVDKWSGNAGGGHRLENAAARKILRHEKDLAGSNGCRQYSRKELVVGQFGVRRFDAAFFLFLFLRIPKKESGVKAPHSKISSN